MSSDPASFHGIFAALTKVQQERRRSTSKRDSEEQESKEVAKKTAEQQQGIGQVAVDIYEQDDYYIIKAPLAGVRLADLDIEVSDNVVTIRGMRQQSDSIPKHQYYLQECFYGEFRRSVTLPCAVDPKRVKATFNKECILKVIIPKEERVKIVRINEG